MHVKHGCAWEVYKAGGDGLRFVANMGYCETPSHIHTKYLM